MVLVCGATGTIGGQVVRQFTGAHLPVRALLRKPPTADKAPLPEGVSYVVGDLSDSASLLAALEGIERVFLVSAVGDHQDQQELNLIHAAAERGVSHVVKLSVMGADAQASFAFGRLHGGIEQQLEASGMKWTMIRPNMLMQNLRWYQSAMALGTLPFPLQNAAVSHVDAKDVAAVAFCALTQTGHHGKKYLLTGPKALTGDEVAETISLGAGKPVRYAPVPMSGFRSYLESNGESPFVVASECELFEAWGAGAGSEVTTVVQDVTGRPPVSLAEFVREHAAELV